jgi:hypothetical protein
MLVYPKDSLYDKNLGVLTTDAAVRLYPENDLGDLQYQTETIAADMFTGAGQNREKHSPVSKSPESWTAGTPPSPASTTPTSRTRMSRTT